MRTIPDLIFQVITKLRKKFLIVLVFYLISFSEAMQLEPEEVTLDGIYNYFSDDFTAKKFYVQIVMQVRYNLTFFRVKLSSEESNNSWQSREE